MQFLAAAAPAQSTNEPPHPILTISGSGSGADTIINNYTEAQYTNNFVPRQSPRNDSYGFVPAVVSGDTGWSWSSSTPNQITSTPSGTVFPGAAGYQVKTQAVLVLSGRTVNVPYYNRAGSTTARSLVFGLIDHKKRGKLRTDLLALAGRYMSSGATHATRDQRYARRIAIALDAWANWLPDYFMTEKNSATFIDAGPSYVLTGDKQRVSDHNGLAHEWADDELLAFDAIYDSPALAQLSAERGYDVRQHIMDNFFFNMGDFFRDRVPINIAIQSNLSGPFTVLALVARVLNRPDYIIWMDQYLDSTVRRKILRDGVLPEGIAYSVGYLNENVSAARNTRDYFLSRAAGTPQLLAISNRAAASAAILQTGQAAWNSARLPNGELPSFGDTTFGASSARNAGASALLPAYGHASLGAGVGAQAVQINQNFSDDANHMRADVTAFVLWAMGNELLGNIRYYNGTPGRQFGEQILAHNAVTIDRVNMSRGAWTIGNNNHRFTSGNLTLYEPGTNGLALTEVDGQRAYSNKASRYQRILLLNTVDLGRPYLVDIFRVTGGTTHDYVLHGSIRFDQTWECSFPLATNTAAYPMLEGSEVWSEPQDDGDSFPYYGFWRDVSSNQAPGNFQITYRDTSASNRDLRLWMTDGGVANVYLGRTPNPERNNSTPPNFYKYWRPSLIMRRRITSGTLQSLFVSVVEPLAGGNSTIRSVQRVPLLNPNQEAVALRIIFNDGRVDTCLVNLRNPRVAGATGGSLTIATADGQYALSGRIGIHMDQRGDSRWWTVASSEFRFPGGAATNSSPVYSGRVLAETREAMGAPNDAFIVDSPLPLATSLRGKQLSLIFDTYTVVGSTTQQKGISEMFQIDRVEQTNGQTHVCFARDHQLEITNATTTVEQMATQRRFTGTNQFEIALSASGPVAAPPTFPVSLISQGAVWRFRDDAVDLGTPWRSNSYNDASWLSGPAELGFGEAVEGRPEATLIASNRQWTTYFRRTFDVPSASRVYSLSARLLRDDGAVVYLNGAEIWRDNMPEGDTAYTNAALSGITGTEETTWLTRSLNPSALIDGPNLLAVELHQNQLSSSDLSFDFALGAAVLVTSNTMLRVTRAGDQLSLTWPQSAAWLRPEYTTNLAVWVPFPSNPTLANGQWMITFGFSTTGHRFFRLAPP